MCDGVGSASGIELIQQLADMELGRVDGNAEPSGNLLVGRALGQHRKHLKLSGGQRGILTGLLRCSCCDECNVRHFAGAFQSLNPGTEASNAASRSARAGSSTSSAMRTG